MILADTSVWIDRLRSADPVFDELLREEQILCHPFVVVELALGSLRQRDLIVRDMQRLPQALVATEPEVMNLIVWEELYGHGIGYVDIHLLASALITPSASLWTRDGRLSEAARQLSVAAHLTH